MKKEMREKLNESIEWLIEQIEKELKVSRDRAITLIEKYLEENW